MSEIRFDSEKELVEGIKQSQAYREFVTRGLGHKIEREKEAWRLLTEHRGGYTSKILNHVFDTVDLNQDNKRHFGSLLAKPNRNLIFGSDPSLINQWFEELLFSGREASVSLNACRKKLKIKGASNGLATLLFYLSDPDRYAIWVNATEAGLVVLRRIDKLRGQDWGKNYTQFNGEAMDFWRNHRLQPQETDWFLTFISSCVKSEDSHFRADEEMLSTEQAPIVWRFGAKKGKPEAPTPPVKTEVDVAQRLTQWRQEATDPAHPNYIHADLDQPAKTYATVSRLLQKLREDPDAFGRDDVVALFGALNSGQRMKNKVANENPLPALRQALIALLDGPGTATERIAAADQAIKNASYNMLGELYGWANTETAPLHNGCAIDALHHLGYSFSDKDYTAFVAAHEQFKQVYQQQVGHLRPDLPLNLEIDKFYNVIDKVDLKKVGDSTPSTQRYWIFQGNPKYYDVIGALRDGAVKTWQVNQHKKEIQPGDKVIIWVTAESSGCYGLATVVSAVQVFEEDSEEASYRKLPTEKGSSEGVTIRVDMNLWDRPVSRAELDALPGFSDFPAGRQGTNLSANAAHFKGIQGLVLERTQIRYWLYAPGPNAKFWDECWQNGIMVYGADELVDLRTYASKDSMEEAFKKALGLAHRPTNDARAAWEFSRVVKPGDVIIAKRGRQQYLGYGIVTGPYAYDTSRLQYRNVRTMRWVKKGEWDKHGSPIVLKALTDITKYPEYVEELKRLIGIEDQTGPSPMPAINLILYGPPGTGKTFALRNEYMSRFTENQVVTREQFTQELAGELTWLQVITIVLYDLGPAKASNIFDHPLLQAKIWLSSNQSPKNTIWAWLQRHTKLDCPNVKYAQRDEPLIFSKDKHAVWTVDREMVDEQLPELIDKLKAFREFKPVAKEIKRHEYVTFHQSYSYEDFVEGIKPVMAEDVADTLTYEVKPGIFRTMVKRASDDPNHDYALLIDEINRGNVASIFGELIALIEDDKRKGAENELRVQLPYSRQEFVVPGNLYIIGAMNTADRSVEALDTALRRRFTFLAMPPQPQLIQQPGNLEVDLQALLVTINARIEKLLDKDHCIGHSYFMGIEEKEDSLDELRKVFATKIMPLLEEYFYGDPAKIGMVLGERFVTRKDETIQWAAGDWGMDEFEERRVYALQDPMTLQVEDFRAVYE